MGLSATVQPQTWIRNVAVDAGPSIDFDAEEAMLGLPSARFASIAEEILAGRHDIDDLA